MNWKCWNLPTFCQTLGTHHNRSRISVHPFFILFLFFSHLNYCLTVVLLLKKINKYIYIYIYIYIYNCRLYIYNCRLYINCRLAPKVFFVSLYQMVVLLTFYASRSWKGFSEDCHDCVLMTREGLTRAGFTLERCENLWCGRR